MSELELGQKQRKRDVIKSKLRQLTGKSRSESAIAQLKTEAAAAPSKPLRAQSGKAVLVDAFQKDWAKVEIYRVENDYPGCRISLFRNPPSDEDLQAVLNFVDAFMRSDLAMDGFITSYDAVRFSGLPRMNLVWAVAHWSAEQDRREILEERAVEARISISSGYTFKFAQMALTAVFKVIPPACRTIIMTDLEDPDAERLVWEAPNPRGAAAQALGLTSQGSIGEAEKGGAIKKASSAALPTDNRTPSCFSQCGGGLLYFCGGKQRRALQEQVRRLEKRQKELTSRVDKLEETMASMQPRTVG